MKVEKIISFGKGTLEALKSTDSKQRKAAGVAGLATVALGLLVRFGIRAIRNRKAQ